ncbi:cytochrome P450 monooxygenase [Pyricularia oryzae Y34]|uniref:Cytochrome P450 monooxygenase n=1 Tax=Pyricularia oryzae (strain Y34) TaxID=1143189 RepID=A0AA97P534_PYRO3|nr:cytochrome P450 monooxygenase [Pyricularia oryzae Y34]
MLLFSPSITAIILGVCAAAYLIRCLRSPLRKVPGPWYSLFTGAGLKYNELQGQRTRYIHKLHLKYGPTVRLSPSEASFTGPDAVREIYGSGGSGYEKTEFYDLFTVYGRRTMFSTLDRESHARRKRVLADRYANTNVMKQPALSGIAERARRFAELCQGSVGGSLDIYPRATPLADKFVLDTSAQTHASPFTLLDRLHQRKNGGDLEQIDIAAECLDHMVAGIDTTGDALCFLMYQLSLPSSATFQRKLQAELAANPDHDETPFDKLPYLDAIVQEGLRCFPAIPMSLPRYVPSGGRHVDGYFMPEGTIVSCQAYSVNRINGDIFPHPETFNPDRWLEVEGDATRRRCMFAFSHGGRGCVGKHLALAEMKLLLRDTYSRYSTIPDSKMTDDAMAMSDQIISSRPAGQKCLMRFIPLVDNAT